LVGEGWVETTTDGGTFGKEGMYKQGTKYPREIPIKNWTSFHNEKPSSFAILSGFDHVM